ncbi:MAG: hypothetical protein MPW17_17280 [Candidatus Manganitrophus sp.]|nr:hypothetical protein [Candidatus Manganitrophus sp.]WDT70492.1 MAG: hypothetical protein MPW17_17280 [Candidatus Manganitrophus sp.]
MKRKKNPALPWNQLKTYSVKQRPSKVKKEEFAKPLAPNPGIQAFLDSLPQILAAKDLRAVIAAMAEAHRRERMIVLAMGAHVIKVGLNPLIIDLMERGIISALALNGAGIIHDFELAFIGQTSEDVAPELEDGTFGMAEETASYLNGAISKGAAEGIGIGEAVGKMILSGGFPHTENSLLAAAARLGIPATVHVAIGTDIIHMHPSADGAAIGKGSYLDFRRYTEVVADLEGGVYFNIGSAVLLPEIFLKALSIARNLGRTVQNFTVVNMDFIQHYRPVTNVVKRPTQKHGKGYALTGHHEIMLPLLIAGLLTELAGDGGPGSGVGGEK